MHAMILNKDDTHFDMAKVFRHLSFDFEDWHEKSDHEKIEAWKNPWWVVASGFFNLFK